MTDLYNIVRNREGWGRKGWAWACKTMRPRKQREDLTGKGAGAHIKVYAAVCSAVRAEHAFAERTRP